MEIKTILFDFDGVLCKDRFYARVAEAHPETYLWIEERLFRARNPILQDWMRGKVAYRDVNALIAENTAIGFSELNRLFVDGVREMKLERELLGFVSSVRKQGVKAGLVTDNMDIFTLVTVPHQELGRHFDLVVNSADYGLLKKDDHGRLFDIALERLGESDWNRTVLIDDSADTIELYRAKGGRAHHYTSIEDFYRTFATGLISETEQKYVI